MVNLGRGEQWLKYVPYARIEDYQAAGWRICEVGGAFCHHDAYSLIMEWTGPGAPPEVDKRKEDK